MSLRVRVLASTATAPGYRLAGLTVDEVPTPAAAGELLGAAVREADIGVLLVEQRLLDAVPAAIRRAIDRRAVPIVVPIPAPNWTREATDAESYIVELLRRAIGYHVRLQ